MSNYYIIAIYNYNTGKVEIKEFGDYAEATKYKSWLRDIGISFALTVVRRD